MEIMAARDIEFTAIQNDINGNPRGVVHYTNFLTDKECDKYDGIQGFNIAHKRAKELGFSKYRGNKYGGMLVAQTWYERDIKEKINKMLDELEAKEAEA